MNKERFNRLVELCENYDLDIIKKEYTKEDLSYDNYDILSYVIDDVDKKDIVEYIGSLGGYQKDIKDTDIYELLMHSDDMNYIDFIIKKFNIPKNKIKDFFKNEALYIMREIIFEQNDYFSYLYKKYIMELSI